MSYFYFAYSGNKRSEVAQIIELTNLDLSKYKTIVEPFCGSFAFSIYVYDVLGYDVKYVLNDNDNMLIDFLKDIKVNGSDKYFNFCQSNLGISIDKYKKIISKKDTNLLNYFYYQKIYYINKGRYPFDRDRAYNIKCNKSKKHVICDKFLKRKNTIIHNDDFKDILDKYKNDKNALLFLDPPYVNMFNNHYKNCNYLDDTIDYIFIILDYLRVAKCKVILSYNYCKIIQFIFNGYIVSNYDHTYKVNKKKNVHCIISN